MIPILDLVLAYNSGIAFSLFDYNNFFTTYGLLIIGIILIVYLHYIYRKDPLSQQNFSIAMILAGAIGNILDRFCDGVVTDFLRFHIGNTSFFIFNIADAYITVGAILFFFMEFKKYLHNRSR
ncbi:uncharacterized protein METZ01_LOCUS99564 [marine metagenome]|uniref:Lipoprotein signal peptidase n=1 Tax=marine metagenome TaxID=408172 RepID=A0A381W2E9_9ZZZZ